MGKSKLPNEKGEWRCSKCEQWLPPSSYAKNKAQKNGLNYCCKECNKASCRVYNYKAKYGLDYDKFLEMFNAQGGSCKACDKKLIIGGKKQLDCPVVDHDHKTGRVRAVLCETCNRIVGQLREDYAYTQKIANYIKNDC